MSDARDPLSVLQAAIADERPQRGDAAPGGNAVLDDATLLAALRGNVSPAPSKSKAPSGDASPPAPEQGSSAQSQPPDGLRDGHLNFGGEVIELPGDLPVDEAVSARFTTFAKKEGLTPAQVRALVAFEGERQRAATSAQADQERAWRQESIRQFSASEIERAQQLIKAHGDDDLAKFLNTTGFGSNPNVIRLLASVARARAEEEW